MKKFLSVFLVVSIMLSFATCFVAAESGNLLTNPGFEDGLTDWEVTDIHSLSKDAHSGQYALQVTKGTDKWVHAHQFPTKQIAAAGDGMYLATCYAKAVGESTTFQLAIKTYHKDKKISPSYNLSTKQNLSGSYQKFEVKFIAYADDFERIDFYFYTSEDSRATMLIDDCSLVKIKDFTSETLPTPDQTIRRPENISVGAIRWDAYFTTSQSAKSCSVSDQVARTLSYYPEQAPYYVEEKSEYDVKFSFPSAYKKYNTTYTLDDVKSSSLTPVTIQYNYPVPWEEEARYALNGGLDYFAYLWYASNNGMALPRKAHVATNGYIEDGRQLKMCGVLEYGHFGAAKSIAGMNETQKLATISTEHKELYQAMAQTSYLRIPSTTGDQPLLYLYSAGNFVNKNDDELDLIEAEAVFYTNYLHRIAPEKYAPVTHIYFAAMDGSALTQGMVDIYRYAGFNAMARYGGSSPAMDTENIEEGSTIQEETFTRYLYNDLTLSKGTKVTVYSNSYAEVAANTYEYNTKYDNYKKEISCIPAVSAGRSCVPRIRISVSWCGDYGLQYSRPGTAEEIAGSLKETMLWVKDNPEATPANTVLIYAWNEHDEGGYLCPTVLTDGKGNILHGNDGKPMINTSVIDAVRDVIYEVKGVKQCKGDLNLNGVPDANDILLLSRHLSTVYTLKNNFALANADFDKNNAVNSTDLTALAKKVAKIN